MKSLLVFVCVVAACLAAVYQMRLALSERGARYLLEARGAKVEALRVVALSETEVLIEDLRLKDPDLSVDRLVLRYDPAGLVDGRLSEIRIEKLKLDAAAGLEDALTALRGGPDEVDGGGSVDLITIVDGQIALGPSLRGTITLNGSLWPNGREQAADLNVSLQMGPLTGSVWIATAALSPGARLEVAGTAEVDLAALEEIDGAPPIDLLRGRGAVDVAGHATLPMDGWSPPELLDDLALEGRLRLDDVEAVSGEILEADLAWAISGRDGTIRVDLARASRVALARFAPKMLGRQGLMAPATGNLDRRLEATAGEQGVSLRWHPDGEDARIEASGLLDLSSGEASARIRFAVEGAHEAGWRSIKPVAADIDLTASNVALDRKDMTINVERLAWRAAGHASPKGELELEGPFQIAAKDVRAPAARVAAATAEGALRIVEKGADWSLEVAPDLALSALGLSIPGVATVEGALSLLADEVRVTQRGDETRIAVSARAEPFDVLVDAQDGPIAIEGVRGRIIVDADAALNGTARLIEIAAKSPEVAVALSDGAASITRSSAEAATEISLAARLRDTAKARRFAPSKIAVAATLDMGRLTGSGEVSVPGQGVSVPLQIAAQPSAMSAEVRFGPSELKFSRKGLQPAALSPLLQSIRDVDGRVVVQGSLTTSADAPLDTRFTFRLDGLAARSGDVSVEGLSGAIDLRSLSPIASAGTQRLRARRVDPGLPLTDVDMRFSITPRGRGQAIRISRATAGFAGGTIALADEAWNTAASTNAATLVLDRVSLGRLMRELRVDGIRGTGALSGAIPFSVGSRGVTISGGEVSDGDSGVVQVDWGAARETLIGSGRAVDLAVRALEDFRYQTLSVAIDGAQESEVTLAIRLEGANPAVLDGHPFNFNINLSGRLDPILKAVRDGRRIGTGLLQGGLGGAR